MDIILISLAALIGSLLTFFSGFGLGTLLLPVFAIFFPVEIAIALTGIVHLLNNLFKMALVGNKGNWRVAIKFGGPAIIGAIIGASLLMYFSSTAEWYSYSIGTRVCIITPVKVVIALLMFGFAILDMIPYYQRLEFSENRLMIGGSISGFFGGLSGHQGALRSAFLIKCGLSKESFIATGVIIASVVDISRISIYFSKYSDVGLEENGYTLLAAVGAAFVGAFVGKRLLTKVTIGFLHTMVTIMITLLALVLGLGII